MLLVIEKKKLLGKIMSQVSWSVPADFGREVGYALAWTRRTLIDKKKKRKKKPKRNYSYSYYIILYIHTFVQFESSIITGVLGKIGEEKKSQLANVLASNITVLHCRVAGVF